MSGDEYTPQTIIKHCQFHLIVAISLLILAPGSPVHTRDFLLHLFISNVLLQDL